MNQDNDEKPIDTTDEAEATPPSAQGDGDPAPAEDAAPASER